MLSLVTQEEETMAEGLKEFDISTELWREYDFGGRVYRIDFPKTLYYRTGGTTHRVVDSKGVAHCVPVPGAYGCVLRWENREDPPVNF